MDTVKVRTHGNFRAAVLAFGVILILLLAAVAFWTTIGRNTASSVLTQNQSHPLDGISTARVVINPGDGNLTVDPLAGGEAVLASASLQYLENQGLPIWSILVFPALFTAGMALIDSLDSVLMLGAYGWAFIRPVRKLYYNLTITFVSVAVALAVGGIEALGLIGDQLSLQGSFWDAIGSLNDSFGNIGLLVIGIFVLSWLVSVIVYRARGYDQLEEPAPRDRASPV